MKIENHITIINFFMVYVLMIYAHF